MKCNPIKLFKIFLLLFKWNSLTWQVLNSSENQGVTVAVLRSDLTAWSMCRETRIITYPTKGAHVMSRPQEKHQQKCPTWVRVKCVLTTLWAFVLKFLQPFTALTNGRAPQALHSQTSSSGTSRGPSSMFLSVDGGRSRTFSSGTSWRPAVDVS
jgi:hypothetical protein